MDLNNTENEWKIEAPSLLGIGNSNPFSVPENYFKESAELIHARVVAEAFRFEDQEEFAVPENYFNLLSENIKSAIALSTLQDEIKEDGFSVPAGYFENLSSRINFQINSSGANSRRKDNRLVPLWTKYAAAACISAIIGTVAFFNLYQSKVERQLDQIPEQEIVNYLQINSDVGDTPVIMENLDQNANLVDLNTDISKQELEQYINTTL